MKFSGKMFFKIILKVTKNQSFTLSFRRYIFWETMGWGIKLFFAVTERLTLQKECVCKENELHIYQISYQNRGAINFFWCKLKSCLLYESSPDFVSNFKRVGINRSSCQMCSMKKVVLRNFTKFTGKHLCQSLFFNKVAGLRPFFLVLNLLSYLLK